MPTGFAPDPPAVKRQPVRTPSGRRDMNVLVVPIPEDMGLRLVGLGAFLWSLRTGQYDDLQGAAERILDDDH